MWIILSIAAAFGNALWTSLSKPVLQDIPPLRMMLLFRLIQSILYVIPAVIIGGFPANLMFWLIIAAIGLMQAGRWILVLHGVKRDYFSTYGMYNIAPLFVLIFAPLTLPERFGFAVWLGVLAIICGGFVFYRTSRFSAYGLAGAVLTAGVNILSKHALNEVRPIVFLFLLQSSACLVLAISYALRPNKSAGYPLKKEIKRIAPLTFISIFTGLTFFFAVDIDSATRPSAVARTNLIFGFLLSLILLKEKKNWPYKLLGAVLILAGTLAVIW